MTVARHLGFDVPTTPAPTAVSGTTTGVPTRTPCADVTDAGEPPGRQVLEEADRCWAWWQRAYPALGAESVWQLRRWLVAVGPVAADETLQVLAKLACPDGGDDLAAAAVLAWVMVPGATRLAHGLRELSPHIDELIAAQLWLQARTVGTDRGRRVAATILRRTRQEVLADLGVGCRADQTWTKTRPVTWTHLEWFGTRPPDPSLDYDGSWWSVELLGGLPDADDAAVRVHQLLTEACRHGVITTVERDLLMALARCAHDAGARRRGSRGGLTAQRASALVGARCGLSERTVRRRAGAALTALRTAAPYLWDEPSPATSPVPDSVPDSVPGQVMASTGRAA